MQSPRSPLVTSADILPDGLLVAFNDGCIAIFPHALLYATLPQATEVKPDPGDELGLGLTVPR